MNDGTILMVEDDPDDEALILRALKKFNIGNEITVVRDGAEALDYLFKTGPYADREDGNPSVVLLDLKLPKIDGLEVLKRIREDRRTQRQPVVVLTSSDEQDDMVRSYELGVNSYVRKPVEFDKFAEAVTNLGLYWLLLNEPPPPTRET
ncbi:MAG: response regulator [SAR202 cluster bacterium]|jgi:CheY-like chemotaxis protein|nr:two-component system response regulator [Rhodospirillaceae bacterium]MQG67944.1 response regulator [SAR202 cluster bacterium]